MNKKILQVVRVAQICVSLMIYFVIGYQLNNEYRLYSLLANTDVGATLLRLSLYAIPGAYLVTGMFGLTFVTRKLLIGMSVVAMLASTYIICISYTNGFLLTIGITMLVGAIAYLLCTLSLYKKEK